MLNIIGERVVNFILNNPLVTNYSKSYKPPTWKIQIVTLSVNWLYILQYLGLETADFTYPGGGGDKTPIAPTAHKKTLLRFCSWLQELFIAFSWVWIYCFHFFEKQQFRFKNDSFSFFESSKRVVRFQKQSYLEEKKKRKTIVF